MSWRTTTLRSAAEVALGRQRSPQHADGPNMVPYLRAANVKDGQLDLSDVKSMNFTLSEQRIFALHPGDVLVTEGSGSLASVGAASVWNGELPGTVCFQNTLLRLRPRAGVDGRFLQWWARSAYSSGLFAAVATGANIYHLSAERVRSLPISFPPLDEQRRIADFLDGEVARVETAVRLRIRQRSLVRERARTDADLIFEKLFRQWDSSKLRYLLLGMEQGWSPDCEDRASGPGEWGVVKAGCVNGGVFDQEQHKTLPPDVMPRLQYRIRQGDLLMSRASGSVDLLGSLARVGHLNRKLLLCDKVYRLHVDQSRVDADFLVQMLRCSPVRDQVRLGFLVSTGQCVTRVESRG